MDMEKEQLVIGYAGTLGAFDPDQQQSKGLLSGLKKWIWTYNAESVDFTTRTGYFLLKGIVAFKENYPELYPSLKVYLWGKIAALNVQQVKKMGLEDCVLIEGYISKEKSIERMNECDVMYMPLESELNGQQPLFIPGKVYEYIQHHKPVLALTGPSDCREILERSGLACIAAPREANAIADQLAFLVSNKRVLKDIFKPDTAYIESHKAKYSAQKVAAIFDALLG
jgi:glycosyltransferase involved in cell wall biosynthesis